MMQNCDGDLPLHVAVDSRAFNAAKALLKVYPQASVLKNQAGNSPLSLLCKNYSMSDFNVEWLDLFLSTNPVSIGVRDQKGNLPSDILRNAASKAHVNSLRYIYMLHNAIEKRVSKHTVKLLLQAFSTSCFAQDNEGRVPLHYACSNFTFEYLENLLLLLDFDPDSLSIEDNQGKTPLQYLSADALVRLENDIFLVHHLAAHSLKISGESLRLLFHYFPKSISTPDKRGMLPFHYAVLNSASTVEVLM
ncbi:MAG: ankyrin repeat domain-containing protein, partial [bacterium]